jgi:hypothetical protein
MNTMYITVKEFVCNKWLATNEDIAYNKIEII